MQTETLIAITREAWLRSGAEALARTVFLEAGYQLDLSPVRITCGWPSSKALARRNRALGECFPAQSSADAHREIFISPVLSDALEALAVLAHELCHAHDDCQHGHKAPFKRLARAIGLEGKATATHAGPALTEALKALASTLGPYPHASLNPSRRSKVAKTYLLKVVCPDCDYTVRVTAKWLEVGVPTCPCGAGMQEAE